MRQLGTLPDADQAARFTDYLVAQGILAQFDRSGEKFAIWVRSEDQFRQAKQEFEKFVVDPANEQYAGHSAAADELRRQRQEKIDQAKENLQDARNLWAAPTLQNCPVTAILITLCLAAGVATNFGGQFKIIDEEVAAMNTYRIGFFSWESLARAGLQGDKFDPFVDIKSGQLWRMVTPIFIHFGLAHILFNSIWAFHLGGLIEKKHGSLFLLALVLVSAVVSNCGEEFISNYGLKAGEAPVFGGGYSGVVYAYFGFVWVRSRLMPEVGYGIPNQTVIIMLAWIIFGFSGLSETLIGLKMGNWAHFLGMLVGIAFAGIHAARASRA